MDRFPIMGDRYGEKRGYVPMAFMLRFRESAYHNHGQGIETLAARGGLSPQEAMAVVQGESWSNRKWIEDEPAWANLRLIVAREFPEWDFGA